MLSTIIYLLSANEHCRILDSGITSIPVNIQSRSKPAFSEPLPSTHHCSRGWARGSSLSICFLISRYEPWEKKRKKKKHNHVLFAVRFWFRQISFFFFLHSQMSERLMIPLIHSTYAVSQATVERRVRKYRDEKLICNCHLDKQRPHPCSLNTTVQSKH